MPDILLSLLDPALVIVILLILLMFNAWVHRRFTSGIKDGSISKGAVSFFLVLVGVLVFILSLPIEKSLKGQIVGFLGIVISAGIALSSSTVLGNLLAGIMNNSMKRFRNGDLIKIGEFQGRVIRKSMFHTEIQLEDSNYISIPNLYIAQNPVKLTRKTNTVISTSVSLGYDISHERIEEALLQAAVDTGLTDPYVYITSLGDFSVVYKIHGFLENSGKYFTTSSLLNARVLDVLHDGGIEIVSPTFMNQRRVDEKGFIPPTGRPKKDEEPQKSPEELVFDEAIKSGKLETRKDYLKEIEQTLASLKEQLKEQKGDEAEKTKRLIQRNEKLKDRIEDSIRSQKDEGKDN